jgi:hypothetical protein
MVDLLDSWLISGHPFTMSRLDYTGSFQVRTTNGCGYSGYKIYVIRCVTRTRLMMERLERLFPSIMAVFEIPGVGT